MNWKNIPVNDEKWSCMVTLLAEEYSSDQFLVTSFENTYHPKMIVNLNRKVLKQHFLWGGIKRNSPHILPVSRSEERTKSTSSKQGKQEAKEIKNYILKVRDLMLFRIASQPRKEMFCRVPGYPTPGPHVYFVLTGFKRVQLIADLLEANVPVNLAISVHFDWKTNTAKTWVEEMDKERGSIDSKKKVMSVMSVSKAGQIQYPSLYWEELDQLIRNHPKKEIFNDFIVVPCKVEEVKNATLEMYGQIMFDTMKSLMFQWVAEMRTYIQYMSSADIVEIPRAQQNDLLVIPYQLMLEMMPMDSTSIELMLHCMVEVIVEKSTVLFPSFKSSSFIVNKTVQDGTQGEEPVLLHHKDKIGIDYVDVDSTGLDIMEIHLNTYRNMPYSTVWRHYEEQDSITRICKQSHVYKLWKCCSVKMPFDMFQLHLHQLIFTKLINLSEKNDETADEDFSQIAFKFEEMSIEDKDNLKLSKFHHCRELLSMFDYTVKGNVFNSLQVEELKKDLLLQCLQDAFNKYNWSYYHYLTLTDKIVFWFKNDFNYEGPTTSEIFIRMDTKVSFREFHSLPKKEKWLKINNNKIQETDEQARKSFIARYLPNFEVDPKLEEHLQFPLPPIRHSGGKLLYDSESLIIDEEIGKFVSYEGPIVTIRRDNVELTETVTLDSFGNTFVLKMNTSNQQEESVKSLLIQTNNGIIFNLNIERVKTIIPSDPTGKKAPRIETDVKLDLVSTLPRGLVVKFVTIDEQVCVYQKYISEELYWDNGTEETLRVYMNDGSIIQFMLNEEIAILRPDSSVTTIYEVDFMSEKEHMMNIEWLTSIKQKERERAPSVKPQKVKKNTLELRNLKKTVKISKKTSPIPVPVVQVTIPSKLKIIRSDVLDWCGVLWTYRDNQLCDKHQELKIRAAHNLGRELYIRRGEISTSYYKYDGTLHFKYADGTLITSIPHEVRVELPKTVSSSVKTEKKKVEKSLVEEPTEDEEFVGFENEYLLEHPRYARVHFKKSNTCSVRLEESTSLTRNEDGTYFLYIDETTTVQFGKELIIIKSKNNDKNGKDSNEPQKLTVTDISLLNGTLRKQPIFKCTDSLMRSLCVYSDGKFECVCLDESTNTKDSIAKDMLYTNKYFVVSRDLSGWEFDPGFCDSVQSSIMLGKSNVEEEVQEGAGGGGEEEKEEDEEEEEEEEEEAAAAAEEEEKNINADSNLNFADSSTSYLNSTYELSSSTIDLTESSTKMKVDESDELIFKVEINNKKLFKSKTKKFVIPYKLPDHKMTSLKKKDLTRDLPLSFKWLFALPGSHYYGTPAIQDSWENVHKEDMKLDFPKPLAVLYKRYYTTDTYTDMYKLYKSAFINYLNYHKEIFQLYKQYMANATFYYFDDVIVPEPTINVKALIQRDDRDVKIQELLKSKSAIMPSLAKII